jgi:hypothetical protein
MRFSKLVWFCRISSQTEHSKTKKASAFSFLKNPIFIFQNVRMVFAIRKCEQKEEKEEAY